MSAPDTSCSEAQSAPGFLANHAARVFNRRVDADLRPHGLSLALLGPLLLLQKSGPMLQRDLVQASAVGQPAMVALLRKLEAQALIVRTPDPLDRRAASIDLTALGRERVVLGMQALAEANRQAMAGFSDEESRLLATLMGRLTANLSAIERDKHHE